VWLIILYRHRVESTPVGASREAAIEQNQYSSRRNLIVQVISSKHRLRYHCAIAEEEGVSPQGHLLLIGVSGAGKTTLSRFVVWMKRLSIFQIKVHNKYTGEDFDEDLRQVLRRSGCKDEKIVFILDESNVHDSGFLERINTLLTNGEVPGLFEGDEFTTLMTQCKEEAQREGTVRSAATWKSNSYI